jgi:hypothetical protein
MEPAQVAEPLQQEATVLHLMVVLVVQVPIVLFQVHLRLTQVVVVVEHFRAEQLAPAVLAVVALVVLMVLQELLVRPTQVAVVAVAVQMVAVLVLLEAVDPVLLLFLI